MGIQVGPFYRKERAYPEAELSNSAPSSEDMDLYRAHGFCYMPRMGALDISIFGWGRQKRPGLIGEGLDQRLIDGLLVPR